MCIDTAFYHLPTSHELFLLTEFHAVNAPAARLSTLAAVLPDFLHLTIRRQPAFLLAKHTADLCTSQDHNQTVIT